MIVKHFINNFKIIILIIFVLWLILILVFGKQFPDNEGFNDELFLICTHSGLYGCEDLKRVYYVCVNAMEEFENKNCSYFDNKTTIERQLDPRRKN
jgi:hypothetical protein